jgi:hypothetical protein
MLSAVLVLAATAGCASADYQLYVRNHSERTWFIRVAAGDGSERVLVRAVSQNSEGLAFAWRGLPDAQIELLDPDCTTVGVFAAEGDRVIIRGNDGIDGLIQPYQWNAQWNVPGIAAVSDCGGFVAQ